MDVATTVHGKPPGGGQIACTHLFARQQSKHGLSNGTKQNTGPVQWSNRNKGQYTHTAARWMYDLVKSRAKTTRAMAVFAVVTFRVLNRRDFSRNVSSLTMSASTTTNLLNAAAHAALRVKLRVIKNHGRKVPGLLLQ
jgi:hypothetical protein